MVKDRISARINGFNKAMLQAIADSLFYDERRNEGNISKALDWVLTRSRTTDPLITMLIHFNKVERGSMEEKDLVLYRALLEYAALHSPELLDS
jgi:hypothetical protein